MPTNLHIDGKLLADAVKAGKHKSKREAVDSALREYVDSRRRLKILELFGTIEYEPGAEPGEVRKRIRKSTSLPRRKRK
jgi:hypothetical protein